MSHAIKHATTLWGQPVRIKIGAQSHLENFYKSHGFINGFRAYMEDGIEHYIIDGGNWSNALNPLFWKRWQNLSFQTKVLLNQQLFFED